jgi:2-hydroxychromene-2-carboxylate isomerase
MAVIEIYYDIVSPYSYLGFEKACRNYKHHAIIFKPFYLGAVMKVKKGVTF